MGCTNLSKESFWSRFANDFEKRNNYVVGKKEIDNLKDHLSEIKDLGNALELGCGDGVFTKMLTKNADSITATDWSKEMVNAAKFKLAGLSSIKLKKENCMDLSFQDESFDSVFMANLLHVIPQPEKAISECKRVLKPKGRIIILSFTAYGMSFFNKMGMIYRYLRTYGKPPKYSAVLTVPKVRQMLEKEGFQVQRVALIGTKMKSVFVIAEKE